MDPNETLRLFREHYCRYITMADRADGIESEDGLSALSDLREEIADETRQATDYAGALFEWLANGGFAPDWTAILCDYPNCHAPHTVVVNDRKLCAEHGAGYTEYRNVAEQ